MQSMRTTARVSRHEVRKTCNTEDREKRHESVRHEVRKYSKKRLEIARENSNKAVCVRPMKERRIAVRNMTTEFCSMIRRIKESCDG